MKSLKFFTSAGATTSLSSTLCPVDSKMYILNLKLLNVNLIPTVLSSTVCPFALIAPAI